MLKNESIKGYLKPPANPHNEPYIDDLNSLFESIYDHDERGVVLTLAAFAEDSLRLLLMAYMREEKLAKKLIESSNSPLGTFAARFTAAFTLGLINKDHYEALEILRKIRNKFAHNWTGVSLDREDIKSSLLSLSPSRFEIDTLADGVKYEASLREKLIIKFSDVLTDIRSLAKSITRSGIKAPLIMHDRKPVQARFQLVDRFTDES